MLPAFSRRHRLATRFGLAFAAFVIAGSLLLLAWLQLQQRAENERFFLALARADADFVQRLNLPRSSKLAGDLGQLLRMQIHFRDGEGQFEPPLASEAAQALRELPLNQVRDLDDSWQALVLKLDARHDMVFLRRTPEATLSLWHPATRHALLAFWGLSAALGWVIARQVVRPVQQLTRSLSGFFESQDPVLSSTSRGDEIGELARVLTQARDDLLNERQKREQSERMALLGRVATGLAHEIKNPLASIQLHAQLIDVSTMEAESTLSLQQMQSEARVIEGLVNQWLYLTRPVPPKSEPLELSAVLEETLSTLQAQAAHAGVTLDWLKPSPTWQVRLLGDRARLQQVFRNVLINAIQAMPMGGALRISVQQSATFVELHFRDQGPGFSDAALAHGSELFFSEKEGGMGVGLNVVQEIISAHGGQITLKNDPQGGACVVLALRILQDV